MTDRFVRVDLILTEDDPRLRVWGLLSRTTDDLLVIWSEDMDAAIQEMGAEGNGLLAEEEDSIVDAEQADTPDAAWAALAVHRLTHG